MASSSIKLSLAQLNYKVGDLEGNYQKIQNVIINGRADLYLFSELALTGYPPEDLLFFPKFNKDTEAYLAKVKSLSEECQVAVAVGAPHMDEGLYNALYFFDSGSLIKIITKKHLPNYGVFDERRYFDSGHGAEIVEFKGNKIRFYICEDLWHDKDNVAAEQVDLLISINASPFEIGKKETRLMTGAAAVVKNKAPLIYLNQVGGQDGIVFDGSSFILSEDNEVTYLNSFSESITCYPKPDGVFSNGGNHEDDDIYNTLILGLRDYVKKNGFTEVLLGLSGGVDSAFCAALACDALGSDKVNLIKLPSRYTSDLSSVDADYFIRKSGCSDLTISISDLVEVMGFKLADIFSGYKVDITEENIQSRFRGGILMALSNKFGHMLITTGNKSEYATGYATLYGDMCGGFAPIKDVYKTDLYKLAKYRNHNIPALSVFKQRYIFNESVLTKEPTAELRDEQKDSDSLPNYDILDGILKLIIEERMPSSEIVNLGYNSSDVQKVSKLLKLSEYKRSQAAPGIKINKNSFHKDWRLPLTSGYDL